MGSFEFLSFGVLSSSNYDGSLELSSLRKVIKGVFIDKLSFDKVCGSLVSEGLEVAKRGSWTIYHQTE